MTKIKVLHYSTHNEDCGIGKYQEQFVAAMEQVASSEVHNEFFPYSPNVTKVMSHNEFTMVVQELRQKLRDFDILHIQHELSFYRHSELSRIIKVAHEMNKTVIMTVHTAPDAEYRQPKRKGYGPHSIMAYLRDLRASRRFNQVHTLPMSEVDLILVHNTVTTNNLVKHGVDLAKIKQITLPVPDVSHTKKGEELRKAIYAEEHDVVIGAVGFISKTKGVKAAVKMLRLLPDNYKLALIGGIHPSGGGEDYLDEVTDLILKCHLKERVYITGYIDDDDRLNRLIKECDVCIYPYDRKYYRYVSSAALNNALANFKPAIVYPTQPFIEMNKDDTIAICRSANYYEMARFVRQADYQKLAGASKRYATAYSYPNEARKLVVIYQDTLRDK